jgi:hypothetical protein
MYPQPSDRNELETAKRAFHKKLCQTRIIMSMEPAASRAVDKLSKVCYLFTLGSLVPLCRDLCIPQDGENQESSRVSNICIIISPPD